MSTPASNAERIEQLERTVRELLSLLHAERADCFSQRRQVFLGVTAAAEGQPYPEDGCQFPILFIDRNFTPVTGVCSGTNHPRTQYPKVVAQNISGEYVPQGTLVQVFFHHPPPGTTGRGKWYISHVGKQREVRRFKLTSELTHADGETVADGVLRFWDATAQDYVDGPAIKLHDWWAESQAGAVGSDSGTTTGMWQAAVGMEGWCIQREGVTSVEVEDPEDPDYPSRDEENHYDILWMETFAWRLEAEATADVETGEEPWETEVELEAAFEQGIPPETVLKLYDYQEFFPHILEGAKVKANRSEIDAADHESPSYRIDQAQQMGFLATATLTEKMCATGSYGIEGFAIATFSPFNLEPVGVYECVNPRGHLGEAGDEVVLLFHADIDTGDRTWWEVIDVTKKKVKYHQIRWNASTKCFEFREHEVAVEYCEPIDESEWQPLLCFAPCPTS